METIFRVCIRLILPKTQVDPVLLIFTMVLVLAYINLRHFWDKTFTLVLYGDFAYINLRHFWDKTFTLVSG